MDTDRMNKSVLFCKIFDNMKHRKYVIKPTKAITYIGPVEIFDAKGT